jgi:hypothetical protein
LTAMEVLLLVAEGPTMFARIGVMLGAESSCRAGVQPVAEAHALGRAEVGMGSMANNQHVSRRHHFGLQANFATKRSCCHNSKSCPSTNSLVVSFAASSSGRSRSFLQHNDRQFRRHRRDNRPTFGPPAGEAEVVCSVRDTACVICFAIGTEEA